MKDKNNIEIKEGDTVVCDPFEFKNPKGEVYYREGPETCIVRKRDNGELFFDRHHGAWKPPINERCTIIQ